MPDSRVYPIREYQSHFGVFAKKESHTKGKSTHVIEQVTNYRYLYTYQAPNYVAPGQMDDSFLGIQSINGCFDVWYPEVSVNLFYRWIYRPNCRTICLSAICDH